MSAIRKLLAVPALPVGYLLGTVLYAALTGAVAGVGLGVGMTVPGWPWFEQFMPAVGVFCAIVVALKVGGFR